MSFLQCGKIASNVRRQEKKNCIVCELPLSEEALSTRSRGSRGNCTVLCEREKRVSISRSSDEKTSMDCHHEQMVSLVPLGNIFSPSLRLIYRSFVERCVLARSFKQPNHCRHGPGRVRNSLWEFRVLMLRVEKEE